MQKTNFPSPTKDIAFIFCLQSIPSSNLSQGTTYSSLKIFSDFPFAIPIATYTALASLSSFQLYKCLLSSSFKYVCKFCKLLLINSLLKTLLQLFAQDPNYTLYTSCSTFLRILQQETRLPSHVSATLLHPTAWVTDSCLSFLLLA